MKKGVMVFTIKEFVFTVTAVLLFFQIYLQNYIQGLQYWDELVTVVCLAKIIIVALQGKLDKNYGVILALLFAIALIGLISNAIAGVQTGLVPILTDIGNSFKVFVVYIGSSLFLRTERHRERIIRALAGVVKLFVAVAFIFFLLHETGIYVMGNDVRYGLVSFRFLNGGAGLFSMMFYSIMLILTLDLRVRGQGARKKLHYVMMALLVWMSTLRARAFAYVIIYLFLYSIMIVRRKTFRLDWKSAIVILLILAFFGLDQIEYYFTSAPTARANLLRYGIYTMIRYFPLGSGFATFGTDAAVQYYSPLYVEYGFNKVWGLSPTYAIFAHDTYWPAICAQFGILGIVLMVIVVYMVCKDVLKRSKHDHYCFFAAVFIMITQVTSSAATATFFHYVTLGLFFMIPLLFENNRTMEGRGQRLYDSTDRIYSHI